MPMNADLHLTLYTAKWCRECRVAKAFLRQHSIPHTEVDIDENPEAAEELERRTGKRAIPHFLLNGQWVQPYRPNGGFLYKEMKHLLGIFDEPAGAPD